MTRADDASLGLEENAVRLVDHDPAWASRFRAEQARLQAACPAALGIEHIGSTAVPDLPAKPILDIALRIADGPPFAALQALGYLDRGEYGIPGRRFFTWGRPVQIHLHVVGPESSLWTEWLQFRDRLRSEPDLRRDYAEAKRDLARIHACSRADYTAAKTPMIQSLRSRKESAP